MEENNVPVFLDTRVTKGVNFQCSSAELYDEYRSFCDARGDRPFYANKFGRMIKLFVPRFVHQVVTKKNGKSIREWRGIGISQ